MDAAHARAVPGRAAGCGVGGVSTAAQGAGRRVGGGPGAGGASPGGGDPRSGSEAAAAGTAADTCQVAGDDVVFRSGAGVGDVARPSGGRRRGPWSSGLRVGRAQDRQEPAAGRAGGDGGCARRAGACRACLEGAGALPFHPFVEAVEAFLGGKPPPEALGHLLHGGRTPAGPVLQPDELRSRLLDGMARFLVGFGAEATVVLVGINSADSHREYPRPRSTPSAPAHSAAARPRPTPPSPCSSIADSRPGPAPGRREGPARYPAGGPVPRRCHGPATSAG